MKANATPLIALFEKKMRLEVPLFQRQYVWNSEQQWEPLWDDIKRKFEEYLSGRTDAPVHFLGAIVLDQKQTPATHVERRMVIDGQQRLTTLQIFLVAFRDFCSANGVSALAEECKNFTLNKGMMPDPSVDKYKIWPTLFDREAFKSVVDCESPDRLKAAFPLVYRKYARRPDPRPRIVECYLFFFQEIADFFIGEENDEPMSSEISVESRLEICFQALRNALQVVAIDLELGDDAQVIFETLNARGEPLLPADLLRNYIFLRAARKLESQENLYSTYWEPFDEPFWREVVSQGRINRPRSDIFLQHYLASKQAIDIPIKHLYVEYRHWIEKGNPFEKVEDELHSLASARNIFRNLLTAESGYSYSILSEFLRAFDIGTVYPLLMLVVGRGEAGHISDICSKIESYLVRRAVCGLTNKNYNRVFLTLTRVLLRDGISADVVSSYLSELTGESAEWPSDERFLSAWQVNPLYTQLNNPRLVFLLKRLDSAHRNALMEDISINSPLTIEHIMPQGWRANWPLPSGGSGLSFQEVWDASADNHQAIETQERDRLLHTIGNLTILSQSLNSAVSNGDWQTKRPEVLKNSLLPINADLASIDSWNEETIKDRSRSLFKLAIELWPRG